MAYSLLYDIKFIDLLKTMNQISYHVNTVFDKKL